MENGTQTTPPTPDQSPKPAMPVQEQQSAPSESIPPGFSNRTFKRGKMFLLGFFIVLLLGVIGVIGYYFGLRQATNEAGSTLPISSPTTIQSETISSPTPLVCTLDAKACSDGSFVGRIPPNCEFAACPQAPTDSN